MAAKILAPDSDELMFLRKLQHYPRTRVVRTLSELPMPDGSVAVLTVWAPRSVAWAFSDASTAAGALELMRQVLEVCVRLPRIGRPVLHALLVIDLQAFMAIHELGYVHGDIKPSNMGAMRSADGEQIVVLDLGAMFKLSPGGVHKVVEYTEEYAAPEVLEDGTASVASDVFSIGKTLLKLVRAGLGGIGGTPVSSAVPHAVVLQMPWSLLPTIHRRRVRNVLAASQHTSPKQRIGLSEICKEVEAVRLALEEDSEVLRSPRKHRAFTPDSNTVVEDVIAHYVGGVYA